MNIFEPVVLNPVDHLGFGSVPKIDFERGQFP